MKAEFKGKSYTDCDEKGYINIRGTFRDGDEISITMELPAMKIEAHPYVTADIGKVALMRGPLLYCLEEADNPNGVNVILGTGALEAKNMDIFTDTFVTVLIGECANGTSFTAIPYYTWANRGKGAMNVWLKQLGKPGMTPEGDEELGNHVVHKTGKTVSDDMSKWNGKLYRRYN